MAFDPKFFDVKQRPPEWERCAQEFYGVATHTRGYNVGRFLKLRRPNEPQEYYDYRMNNYQALTQGAWLRAEDKCIRTLSVKFDFESSDYLYDYLNAKRFQGGVNYWTYNRQFVIRRCLEDANGYATWIPHGEGLVNPAVKIDIKPYLIYSIYTNVSPRHTDNDYIIFCMPEAVYSWGDGGRFQEMEYWAIDREWYYKIKREGKDGDFVSIPYYRHNLGFLPVVELPGNPTSANTAYNRQSRTALFGTDWNPYPTDMNGAVLPMSQEFPFYVDYKQSFFAGFVPSANVALNHFADAEAALLMCGYPTRVEEWSPCPTKGCGANPKYPGRILGDDGDYHACGTCDGKGVIIPNPLGKYIRKRVPSGLDEKDMVTDPITIINGVPESVKILYDNAFEFLKRAESDVWLKDTEKVMSAEQVVAGNDGAKSMIKRIGDALLHMIEGHMRIAEYLTAGSSPIVEPVIDPPIDYSIIDENEAINNISVLSNSFASKSVKVKYEKELAKIQSNGRDEAVRAIDIKVMWDMFYGNNETEIGSAVMVEGVSPIFAQKHRACDTIVARLLARNGTDWLYQPDEKVMADMDAEFEAMNIAKVGNPALDPFSIEV